MFFFLLLFLTLILNQGCKSIASLGMKGPEKSVDDQDCTPEACLPRDGLPWFSSLLGVSGQVLK